MVRQLTHKLLGLAWEELGREDTRRHVREQLVHPMVRLAYEQAAPYLLAGVTVVVAILLVSLASLGLSLVLFLKQSIKHGG